MRALTLQRLEIFRAVYEETSVSAAAARLGLTQPTVSRHLRDFEAAIGLSLFTLTLGRLSPTPEADVLYGDCVFLSEGASRVEASIEAMKRGEARALSAMVVSPLVRSVMPRAIKATTRALPSLSLTVEIGAAHDQLRALRKGILDVGILAGLVQVDPGMRKRSIGTGRFVCLAPEEHPLADRISLSMTDLRGHGPRVTMPRRPLGRILHDALDAVGVEAEGLVTAGSLQFFPGLAAHLRVPVIVDVFTALGFPEPSIRVLPLDDAPPFEIFAVTPRVGGQGMASAYLIAQVERELARFAEEEGKPPYSTG
jgi:DNA-binding transcriptional LysR family regulator